MEYPALHAAELFEVGTFYNKDLLLGVGMNLVSRSIGIRAHLLQVLRTSSRSMERGCMISPAANSFLYHHFAPSATSYAASEHVVPCVSVLC